MSRKKCESANYVWFEDDELGKGATALVYKCRHRESGEICAVKVLKSSDTSDDKKDRESSILRTLKHENVVSLLAVEKCEDPRTEVIIMEYCSEGDLQSFLSKPENAFGLCESDLLTVLRDVVSGMEYMRSQKVSHRDIKPLNILRSIRDDGTAVHKLADFGFSRVVKDGEHFASVVGTEEYMHPDMYYFVYHAGIAYCKEKKFKPTVDLWSFGVTMYYCITGKLPFDAFLHRNDKDTMFNIISKRSPNDISGIQKQENGDIEWSSSYPENCRIPRELQELFLPIQRGVFDTAENTEWTFDFFFDKITGVLKRKKIQAVDVFSTQLHSLYLSDDCRLDDIQLAASNAAGMQMSDLLLLCNNAKLDAYGTSVSFGDQSSLHSSTSLGRGVATGGPLFAFSRSKNGSRKPISTVLLRVDLEARMDSKMAIAAAQRLLFAAQDASDRLDLINNGMLTLLGHQRQSLLRRKAVLDRSSFVGASKRRVQPLRQLLSSTTQYLKLLEHFTKTFISNAPGEVCKKSRALTDSIAHWEDHRTKINSYIERHDFLLHALSVRPEDEHIAQKWKEKSRDPISSLRNDVSCIQRLCQALVQQEKEIKACGSYKDKREYAKKLFAGHVKRIQELYSVCQNTVTSFEKCLTDWITNDHLSYTEHLEKTILEYDSLAASYEQLMNDYDVLQKNAEKLIDQVLSLHVARHCVSLSALPSACESMQNASSSLATAQIGPLQSPSNPMATTNQRSFFPRSSASTFNCAQHIADLLRTLELETMTVVNENKRLLADYGTL